MSKCEQQEKVEELSLADQCKLGAALEMAISGSDVNLADPSNTDILSKANKIFTSTDTLKDVTSAFANQPLAPFVGRLAGVPNLHAVWALSRLNSGGKARYATDFARLWTTTTARAAFGRLVDAVNKRDNTLRDQLLDDIELRNVAVRVLWLLVGSTQAGKSTLLSCMRAIADREFAGVANGGVAAPMPSVTKDTPNTSESALFDLTTALNVIDAGDSRGFVDAKLLERVIASIAVATGTAAYGYDSEDNDKREAAAGAVKRKASIVVVCVNASQFAPLWMRALRIAKDGTISIDEKVEADANVRLDDPAAWRGLVELRTALGRLGIEVFVVLTHVDCLRGSIENKCAEFKSIFQACPLSIEMKDFVMLPARESACGAEMCAYTYKKVACIMLRLIKATLQHTNLLAAIDSAKAESQPSAVQRAVGRLRGDPVVAPLSVDELLKKKLSAVDTPPPSRTAPAPLSVAAPGVSPALGGLLLLIAAVVIIGAILMAQYLGALKELVVQATNEFEVLKARMDAPFSHQA